jgi:hypothetical protein
MTRKREDITEDAVQGRARMLDNHAARASEKVLERKRATEAVLSKFGL